MGLPVNVVLSQGILSGFSCTTRPFIAACLPILLGLLVAVEINIGYFAHRKNRRQRTENARANRWISLIVLGLSTLFSLVPLLAPIATTIGIEGNALVERGCKRWSAYELRSPLLDVHLAYRPADRGGGPYIRLISGDYRIRLNIPFSDNARVAAVAAAMPGATRAFVAQQKEKGLALPQALVSLGN